MRIILFLVLILLVVLIFAISDEIIKKKNKKRILALLIVIFAAAYFFTFYTQNQQDKDHEILLAFEQGKTIKCGDTQVNSTNFTFEYGTQSFIAKKDKQEFSGLILPISKCEIQ